VGTALVLAYVVFSIFYYRQSLRHLKKPFFWFQVLVLTFLATLFYNGFQQKTLFSYEGLMAGLQMNLRAVLILVGFSSISVELRNPLIKTVLIKRGFSRLYESLGLAFSALPWIINNFASPRQMLKQPTQTIAFALASADALLASFRQKTNRPKVVILTGEKHEGKTTFARSLAEYLKKENFKIGGFLAPGTFERGQRKDFEILCLETGMAKPLCSINNKEGEQMGPFGFYALGQEFGKQLLSNENTAGMDFIFIDEIGPLEMKGLGWASSIDLLMESSTATLIWIVRKNLVESAIKKWKLHHVAVYDIRNINAKQVFDRLSGRSS
jgi:nucleoside-triphosphatase THEP1